MQQPGREILHCLHDFGLWNIPYLHSAACALKWYYACERGELRFFHVLVDKWKPVLYGQKEMIDLFWVSFSLTQKKIYFLKLWWNGCFTNRAFLHAIKIALKDTPLIDVKIELPWNTDIIWWVWCSHWREESTGAETKLFLSFHATVLCCCSVHRRGELASNMAPSFRDVMLHHR